MSKPKLHWNKEHPDNFDIWILFEVWDDGHVFVDGIATDKEHGERWIKMCEMNPPREGVRKSYYLEQREVNHLFGQTMIQGILQNADFPRSAFKPSLIEAAFPKERGRTGD